ncbi:MAG: class I SAM-dependent methyltransferase [Rhodobacteraceae bacterium]|nr:class I SAM-dependent methyltransferase [Paracoccaceae bacterium]
MLEFGCGTGTTSVAHAPFVNHIDALDVAENMLAFGREKATQAGVENVSFIRADINSFDPPDKKYNVIMGHSILHLLEDKQSVISKVYSMLKPGGFLCPARL